MVLPDQKSETLPSGLKVKIRETNGEDDAVISNRGDAEDGSSFDKFIAGIVTEVNGQKVKLSPEEVRAWKVRDRMSILLKSRIFSIGPVLKFNHTCTKCGFKNEPLLPYEEDLEKYDWDYSKPVPKFGEPGYSPFHIPAYELKGQEYVEFFTPSRKQIRYKFLDGEGERKFLDTPGDSLNKNLELISRSIEFLDETNKWVKITNFKFLSSRDMNAIRASVNLNDTPHDVITKFSCPKCGKAEELNIMGITDFFFPVQI